MFWKKKATQTFEQFEIASGSVTGSQHRRLDKNNQDAYGSIHSNHMLIPVVCDGASKGRDTPTGDWTHSEVGAQLSMEWVLNLVQKYCHEFLKHPHQLSEDSPFPYWEDVRQELLDRIFAAAVHMDGCIVDKIVDYFLCTVVGVMVTPYGTCMFSLGDGVYLLNGEFIHLGPFPGNMPPYPAYGLTGSTVTDAQADLIQFKTQYLPTEHIQNLLIGTDGVVDLLEICDRHIPGTTKTVGSISQFWLDDIYFTNPIALSRQLQLINRHSVQLDREAVKVITHYGLLPDDTTCIVIRRRRHT